MVSKIIVVHGEMPQYSQSSVSRDIHSNHTWELADKIDS